MTRQSDGRLKAEFRLWDVFAGQQLDGKQYFTTPDNWRRIAHIISDAIYETLTGEKGYFDSRVVFVDETGPKDRRVKRLTIMDQDGANVKYLTRGDDLVLTPRLAALLPGFKPELRTDGAGFHLLIDGREVREEIRTPSVSRDASVVAKLPVVRLWVKEHLRWLARDGGVVADGRDQGTAVFPEADHKFYLDAALATRAARRLQDWQRNGDPPTLEQVRQDLAARDRQDETRDEAPLTVPPGAVVIDTTDLNVDEVVDTCLTHIRGT